MSSPLFAGTIYGGLEDWNGLDYDYNDIVFSLSGSGLSLHSSAQYFAEPTLGTSATPFWNRSSMDGANYNIGYCIYGGGNCNGGAALAPGFKYLAANQTSTGSANDVSFSANGQVQLFVTLENTTGKDRLGWYALSNPTTVNWLDPFNTKGIFTFNPGGAFGLVGRAVGGGNPGDQGGYTYYSQDWYGSSDAVSHFAFFADPGADPSADPSTVTPEPSIGSLVLFGLLALGVAILPRKMRAANR